MNYQIIKCAEIPLSRLDKRFKLDTPKKLAEKQGSIHYLGDPCTQGHSGLRYTKGSTCVECVISRKNKAMTPRQRSLINHHRSLEAAQNGSTTYIPEKPCSSGHTLRFVNSNNCVECDKSLREKHKISQKYHRIKNIYGLSKDDYLNLVAIQNSSCVICLEFKEDHFSLNVDHCHETGKVRGLLCNKCNQGIGLFKHSKELLVKAAKYCEQDAITPVPN